MKNQQTKTRGGARPGAGRKQWFDGEKVNRAYQIPKIADEKLARLSRLHKKSRCQILTELIEGAVE